jgi:putative FmdB family regulatory protein
MPLYEYRCPDCNSRSVSETRADRLDGMCPRCGPRTHRRVFGFNHKPGMEQHWNTTVGQPISSMTQFNDALKQASEAAAREQIVYTADGEPVRIPGVESNFQPLEWGDHAAFGATGDGIAESNSKRSKAGLPLLPEINT